MGCQYLKQEERQDLVMLCSLIGYVEHHFLNKWNLKRLITPKENNNLRAGLKSLEEALDSILSKLNKDFGLVLYRDINNTDIFCMPKEKAQNKKDKYLSSDDCNTVKSIQALAEKALYWCDPCNNNPETCDIKKALIELGIEPYDLEAKTTCPYLISKGSEQNE